MHTVCLRHSGSSVVIIISSGSSSIGIDSGRDDHGEDDNAVDDGPRDKGYDIEDKGKSSTAAGSLIVTTLVMVLGLEGGGEGGRRGGTGGGGGGEGTHTNTPRTHHPSQSHGPDKTEMDSFGG